MATFQNASDSEQTFQPVGVRELYVIPAGDTFDVPDDWAEQVADRYGWAERIGAPAAQDAPPASEPTAQPEADAPPASPAEHPAEAANGSDSGANAEQPAADHPADNGSDAVAPAGPADAGPNVIHL